MSGWALAGAVAALACGTYAIRFAGVYLRSRLRTSSAADAVMERATIVLLVAVGLTGALFAGGDVAGPAKPIGVAVAVAAAWFRAPLVVVIVGAAATTALLRLAGVP